MESTNELIPKVLAVAEGLNITSSNECLTKREFAENFIRGLELIGVNGSYITSKQVIIYINTTNVEKRILVDDVQTVTIRPVSVSRIDIAMDFINVAAVDECSYAICAESYGFASGHLGAGMYMNIGMENNQRGIAIFFA